MKRKTSKTKSREITLSSAELSKFGMEKFASQVNVKTVNDSFNSANDVFGGFREFYSDLFSK